MNDHIEYPKEAGIYKITCNSNGKVYIGKSVNINKRLKEHRRTKGGFYFQNAILKYGWDSFEVEILEIMKNFDKLRDNEILLQKESFYINLYDSTNKDKGYNRCKYSADKTGIMVSDSTKEKMRQAHIGKKLSEEHKEKLSQVKIGKPSNWAGHTHSDETKEKMRQSKSGKPSNWAGHTHSDETKEKISRAKKGKPSNRLGVVLSEETKEKMRQSKLKVRQSNMIEENNAENE